MPKRLGFKIALFFVAAAAVSPADADAIGKVTDVARKTTADAAGAHRELDLGSDVAAKDTLITDKVGKAALRFVDETQLSIGPNSSVRLDDFVFSRPSDPSSFVIRATRGVFRFATGRGDHDAYRIHTPTATLGVRGTQFDVKIEGKQVRVSVLEGEVVLCPHAGRPNFVDCVEAIAGQSILSSRSRADVVPTSSLPQLRADLLPLSTVANLGSGFVPIVNGAIGGAASSAGAAANAATGTASGTASSAIGGIGSSATSTAAGLGNAGATAGGTLGGMGSTAGGIGSPAGNIGGALGGAGGALGGVGNVGGALGGIGSAAGGLGGAIGGVGGGLGGIRVGR
jgi:hypothetical protein